MHSHDNKSRNAVDKALSKKIPFLLMRGEPCHDAVIAEYRRVHGASSLPAEGGVVSLQKVIQLRTVDSLHAVVQKVIHGYVTILNGVLDLKCM